MGLKENLSSEQVSRLALREPVLVGPADTIRFCIEKMRERELGCAIVVDDDNRGIGMLTESMIVQMLVHKPVFLDEQVEQHMSAQWPWVKITDPVAEVLEAMTLKNVRFLCVVDDDGRVVGLTGQKGLMEYVAEHFPRQVMVQRIGCAPYLHSREGA
jgi:CBS domain-containing protein